MPRWLPSANTSMAAPAFWGVELRVSATRQNTGAVCRQGLGQVRQDFSHDTFSSNEDALPAAAAEAPDEEQAAHHDVGRHRQPGTQEASSNSGPVSR